MPMMRPFPQVHTGLVPFSITYTWSQTFVTPPGCSNVKLVGRGAGGRSDEWLSPYLARVRAYTNNFAYAIPGWGTVDYDGVSWDELNSWIAGYYASYGSADKRTATISLATSQPQSQNAGINVYLIFASANPADSDVPVKYGLGSPRPMLLPDPTNYPTWSWGERTIIGNFTGPLVVTRKNPGNNQQGTLTSMVTSTAGPPPTGNGPITWGSMARWRYSPSVTPAAELQYEIGQPGFIWQPGLPYSMPINGFQSAFAVGGQDATGFGRTFPGGQLIVGNYIAGDPECYSRTLGPVEQTFPTNATSPGAANPLVVPNGAQITVSGLRFP